MGYINCNDNKIKRIKCNNHLVTQIISDNTIDNILEFKSSSRFTDSVFEDIKGLDVTNTKIIVPKNGNGRARSKYLVNWIDYKIYKAFTSYASFEIRLIRNSVDDIKWIDNSPHRASNYKYQIIIGIDFEPGSSLPWVKVWRVNDGTITSMLSQQINLSLGAYDSSYIRVRVKQQYYSSVDSVLTNIDILPYVNGEINWGDAWSKSISPNDIGNTEEFYFKCVGSNATKDGELIIEGSIGVNENYPTLEVDNDIDNRS